MSCYAATPEFKARRDKHLTAARQQYRPVTRSGEERQCANPACGKTFYAKPSDIKRGKKTCSRACYRAFMAGRFDRAIAAPVSFREMQGFDEFLSQDKLSCLVDGCDWIGHNLGLHMNQSHGIAAEDFKKMAGFNLTTGLVSRQMEKHLSERGARGTARTLNPEKATASRKNEYVSAERREHATKAALLRRRDASGRWIKEK